MLDRSCRYFPVVVVIDEQDFPMTALLWADWPRCPVCDGPRQTVCPACGRAGTQFPLAPQRRSDVPLRGTREARSGWSADEVTHDEILLVCAQCDSVFTPQFYRRCARCGYDAGAGIEVEPTVHEGLSLAGLLIVGGVISLLTLLLWYFRGLFQP